MTADLSIGHLVLDLGGVACRWLPDRRLAALEQLSGLPAAVIDQQVFDSGFDDAGERGQFTLDGFRATLGSMLGLTAGSPTDRALRAAWAQAYEPDASVLALAAKVSVPTALFTNNGPLMAAALDEGAELGQVGAAFGQLVLSCHLGVTKPDAVAFERAAELLGADPSHLLLVDDDPANVDAARHAGWQARHFTTVVDLQAALAAAGLV